MCRKYIFGSSMCARAALQARFSFIETVTVTEIVSQTQTGIFSRMYTEIEL